MSIMSCLFIILGLAFSSAARADLYLSHAEVMFAEDVRSFLVFLDGQELEIRSCEEGAWGSAPRWRADCVQRGGHFARRISNKLFDLDAVEKRLVGALEAEKIGKISVFDRETELAYEGSLDLFSDGTLRSLVYRALRSRRFQISVYPRIVNQSYFDSILPGIPCANLTWAQQKTIGLRCMTSTGGVFERTARGWTDLATGIEWGLGFQPGGTYDQAAKYCASQGDGWMLPTAKDFAVADRHGFRDIYQPLNNRIFFALDLSSNESGGILNGKVYRFLPNASESGPEDWYLRYQIPDGIRCQADYCFAESPPHGGALCVSKKRNPEFVSHENGKWYQTCSSLAFADRFRIGTRCITTQGHVFSRVLDPVSKEIGWRDETNQLLWFYRSDLKASGRGMPYGTCEKKRRGQRLPANRELYQLYSHGFLEVTSSPWAFLGESDYIAGKITSDASEYALMCVIGKKTN